MRDTQYYTVEAKKIKNNIEETKKVQILSNGQNLKIKTKKIHCMEE